MIFMPFACTETLFHITDWRESEISLGKIVIFHFKLAEHSSNEAPDWLMRHLIDIFQMWLVFFNLSVSVDVVWRKWHFGQLIITHQTLKQTFNNQQRSSKKKKKIPSFSTESTTELTRWITVTREACKKGR